jgi:hypothetical protein
MSTKPPANGNRPSLYFALIGDLVESRRLENRAAVQRRLESEIDAVNGLFGEDFASPFRLTAGDEVQGLGRAPGVIMDALVRLSDRVAPVRFAWGLGYGKLSTDEGPDVAHLDGPCFHRAREGLRAARKDGVWFGVRGLGAVPEQVLAALMNLIGDVRAGWTETQLTYIREARTSLQVEVAERFGVDPSTVSRALSAASFARIKEGERAARTFLESLA